MPLLVDLARAKRAAARSARDRARRRRIKRETIDAYGGQCACCGEREIEFLTIDHVGGGGAEARRAIWGNSRRSGWPYYFLLGKMGYPQEGLRVLCANCQLGTRAPDGCPHARMRT